MKSAAMDCGVDKLSCSVCSVLNDAFSCSRRGMRLAFGLMNWVWMIEDRSS